jgi:hypothetical protein
MVAAHRDGLSWWTRDDLFDEPIKATWQWDVEDVGRYLSLVDGMDEETIEQFKDHHVTGVRLMRMSAQQLMAVGVDNPGLASKMLDEIMRIRKWGVSKHTHQYVVDDDQQPESIFHGILEGLEALIRGILEGIFGLIYEPVKQIRQDGADGCFGGIGTGIQKIVFSPLGGLADCVRAISDGIKTPKRYSGKR